MFIRARILEKVLVVPRLKVTDYLKRRSDDYCLINFYLPLIIIYKNLNKENMSGSNQHNNNILNTSNGGGNLIDNDDSDFMGEFDYGNNGF